MGLLDGIEAIDRLDLTSFQDIAAKISEAGIARNAMAELSGTAADQTERLRHILLELDQALLDSPLPEYEWPALEGILGAELLGRLTGVSVSSLRRYRTARRRTPDAVAARLHFLALIVGDLAGAYNDLGIRRWFERKRSLIGGQAPIEILTGAWAPEDPGPSRVRELAQSLAYSPAT